jgi:hypothetical protein
MSEFERELRRLGRSYFDITEFDVSLNDATRRDINRILDSGYAVFGLKMWDFRFLSPQELRNAGNFSVDFIFLEKDRSTVEKLIEDYKARKIAVEAFIKKLCDLAVYDCWWV